MSKTLETLHNRLVALSTEISTMKSDFPKETQSTPFYDRVNSYLTNLSNVLWPFQGKKIQDPEVRENSLKRQIVTVALEIVQKTGPNDCFLFTVCSLIHINGNSNAYWFNWFSAFKQSQEELKKLINLGSSSSASDGHNFYNFIENIFREFTDKIKVIEKEATQQQFAQELAKKVNGQKLENVSVEVIIEEMIRFYKGDLAKKVREVQTSVVEIESEFRQNQEDMKKVYDALSNENKDLKKRLGHVAQFLEKIKELDIGIHNKAFRQLPLELQEALLKEEEPIESPRWKSSTNSKSPAALLADSNVFQSKDTPAAAAIRGPNITTLKL